MPGTRRCVSGLRRGRAGGMMPSSPVMRVAGSKMTALAGQPAITLLYDGMCPICSREIRWLKWLDRRCRLRMLDITDPQIDPRDYGITREQAMAAMHGLLPNGTIVVGMEAFRRAYGAVGLG